MKWFRKLFRRKTRATLILTLKFGTKIEVGTVVCPYCKNYFFAARMEFELPSWCPYCGNKFEGFNRNDYIAEKLIV